MLAKDHAIGAALLGAALLTAAPARADDPCAKFAEPLAYNSCLAKQGPEWHGTHGAPMPADVDAPKGAGGWSGPGRRVGSELHFGRGKHGRMVVEFDVGGAPAAAGKKKVR
jgi:hypothetical protein